jgi:hypothetical protein
MKMADAKRMSNKGKGTKTETKKKKAEREAATNEVSEKDREAGIPTGTRRRSASATTRRRTSGRCFSFYEE